jgi:hypothetical protein
MVFVPQNATEKERLFVMQGPLWVDPDDRGWYVVLSMSGRLPNGPDISACVLLIPPPPPPSITLH